MIPKIPQNRPLCLTAALVGLASSVLILGDASAEFAITEFLARSTSASLQDEDNTPADWIELHNGGTVARSLAGYYLTDNASDLTKWQLPDVSVPAGGYQIVFATGKNRAVAGAPLHTNFSLGGGGEFLALVAPDGTTLVTSFAPEFPEQYDNISYGTGTGGVLSNAELVTETTTIKYFPPTGPVPGWETAGFDDSAWSSATNGVGWGYPELPGGANGSQFEADARNGRTAAARGSTYLRIPFEVAEAAGVVSMVMEVLYEDGFVAYLNGFEVASSNKPASLSWNSVTGISIEENDGPDFYPLDFAGHLVDGTNVLAIQAMNNSTGSSDFYMQAQLDALVQDLSLPPQRGFFEEPTPGAPNGLLSAAPPARVEFSASTQAFTTPFQLSLSVPTPGAMIHYTTNGTLPTDDPGSLYTGPISINATTQVRARAFLPGTLPAETRSEGFFKLTADAAAFTSNLPIVLIDSFGGGAPPETGDTNRRTMMMAIWEPKGTANPRSSMLNPPDLVTRMGARKRGSSSGGWPKYAMSVEVWTENEW